MTLTFFDEMLKALKPLRERIIGATVYWDERPYSFELKGKIVKFVTDGKDSTLTVQPEMEPPYDYIEDERVLSAMQVRYEPRA